MAELATIARPYAEALFRVAKAGSLAAWSDLVDEMAQVAAHPEVQALAQNPYLHLMVQSGYYDGACDYFNAKYNMWQLDPAGKLKNRISFKGYRSGHMMYLRKEDLATANQHLRDFILKAIPGDKPAKY